MFGYAFGFVSEKTRPKTMPTPFNVYSVSSKNVYAIRAPDHSPVQRLEIRWFQAFFLIQKVHTLAYTFRWVCNILFAQCFFKEFASLVGFAVKEVRVISSA